MELVRVTNPMEMFACKDKVYPLFEAYYEKAKYYIENLETPDVAWQNCVNRALFPDYYFYLLRDGDKFIGYFIGCIVRMPYFTVLYTMDYYIPKRGVEFSKVLKQITQILGVDEVWGEAPENIYRTYRKGLKGSTVKKVQMVRINL